MRWLLMPVVSARNISAAPSYNWVQAFRKFALADDPHAVFYIVVPREGDGTNWKGGADWSGPRTYLVPTTMQESQFADLTLVTREVFERFNERFGDLFFDVCVTEKPMLVPILKHLMSFHIVQKSRRPLIVVRDQFVQKSEWFKIPIEVELLQAMGWWSAPTAFQSPHQLAVAVEIARKHLVPARVREMRERARVVPLGIDCDEVDQLTDDSVANKLPEITVNYSAKLFTEQRFLESLKIMDSTFAGGRPIQLQIVTGSSPAKMSMMKRARVYQWMTIYGNSNRREFLHQMGRAHVFISNSIYEDFSATVVEQMYAGLLPVLLDADWSRYLVPEGYPYLFRTMDEGQAMLRYVVDHYEELAVEWQPRMREKIRREFDLKLVIPAFIDWCRQLHRKHIAALKVGSLPELVDKAMSVMPPQFDAEQFYAAVEEQSDGLKLRKDVESRSTSKWLVLDLLLSRHGDKLIDDGKELISWSRNG